MSKIIQGVSSEYLVKSDLLRRGIIPCSPSIHSTPYDLIAVKDLNPFKVQVKSSTFVDGKMEIHFRKSNGKSRRYTKEEVDVIAICERDSGRIAYLPFIDVTKIILYEQFPESMIGINHGAVIRIFDDYRSEERRVGKECRVVEET